VKIASSRPRRGWEALLLEGLNSGDPTPLDSAKWANICQEVKARIGAKRRPA
jgi:hypothetical protein